MAATVTQTQSERVSDPNAAQKDKQTVICVFCGASDGSSPAFKAAARSLAQVFHDNHVRLVYGAGTYGMMGELARTLVALSGPEAVHGIIPKALLPAEKYVLEKAELAGRDDKQTYGITTVVQTMHERKELMAAKVREGGPGSGFIALPGGFGTLDELAEMTTLTATGNQLKVQDLGVVLFNVEGFYDSLIKWIRDAVNAGFIRSHMAEILVVENTAKGCYKALKEYNVIEGRLDLTWS